MIRRAQRGNEVTDDMVTRIRQAVEPWRIVLFGSRARGDFKQHSDYDLYVEVSEDGATLKELHHRIRTAVGGGNVDIKVNRRGHIERRRDDPGTIEWDVAREGRVLYAAPDAPTRLAPPKQVRESSGAVPESLTEWIELAERDLRHIKLLRDQEGGYSPEICWYSHQSCEKYMKALLVSRRVRPERTHDLTVLLAMLRKAGCALRGLDDDCALLTNHAIRPRYPAGLSLGVDDAERAFVAATRLIDAVRQELPPNSGVNPKVEPSLRSG
jgi:HEPN domain-containing protein/predicted nucleotidyltransferase